MNIKFKPDNSIGIYGITGVGKWSFVDLLTGLLKPDSGETRWVLVDPDMIRHLLPSFGSKSSMGGEQIWKAGVFATFEESLV